MSTPFRGRVLGVVSGAMKVVSWNVNGLRAALKNSGKELKEFLDSLQADVLCFQEIKATRDQLDSSLYTAEGYNGYFSFCKTKTGYSGVVTFCKDSVMCVAAEEGLTGMLSTERVDAIGYYDTFSKDELVGLDSEGRAVLTEHKCVEGSRSIVVVNVYCPRVDSENPDPDRMEYKLRFYSALQQRCTSLATAGKLVIAVGDFNCSREAIDSAYAQEDPSLLKRHPLSREWMNRFVVTDPAESKDGSQFAMVDTFRHLHKTQEKVYTCWNTMLDCRKTNYGTRLDYIAACPSTVERLVRSEAWTHMEGSDHCPVFAEFALAIIPHHTPPSLCSRYFSTGKQKTLSSFLVKSQASSSGGTKRSVPSGVHQPPAKFKRKNSSAIKQTTLAFAKAQQNSIQPDDDDDKQLQSALEMSMNATSSPGVNADSQRQLSDAWKSVFSAPPKAPLCEGHREACVLRTVKKAGPNRHKQFWVCARPAGGKDDPNARCDFFKWKK